MSVGGGGVGGLLLILGELLVAICLGHAIRVALGARCESYRAAASCDETRADEERPHDLTSCIGRAR